MSGAGPRDARSTASVVAALRVALGIALSTAPRIFVRANEGAPDPGAALLARTVGVRDLVLGAGTGLVAHTGTPRELRRWLAAGLASDVLDVVAASTQVRSDGRRFLPSALIPLPVIAADVFALLTSAAAEPTARTSLRIS